jgi:deazaflavin-dependent oxidoreductase (nitroreductase family)
MNGLRLQQQDQGIMTYPAVGWRKAMFKAPIFLWRMGLGPILGQMLMLITHTGRRSGLPRRTMVEYHTLDGQRYAPCAFGARAQWYRNIMADPYVTIQTAAGTEHVKARRVTDSEELLAVYALLRQRNPIMLDWYLQTLGIAPNPDSFLANKDRVYIVAFDPADGPTPPPLEADLKWVWGVVAALIVLRWLFRPRRKVGG